MDQKTAVKRRFEFHARMPGRYGVFRRVVIEADCMVADEGLVEFWSNDRIIAIIDGTYPIHELDSKGLLPIGVVRSEVIGPGGARVSGRAKNPPKLKKSRTKK